MSVSPNQVNSQIDRFGSQVILRVNTISTSSPWGDRSYTTSDSVITVVINDLSGDEVFNKEGIYKPGDKVFFAKSTQDNLDVGNEIIYDSTIYRIKDPIKHHFGQNDQVQEVRCSKVEEV
jgi:hypothetical protein